MRTSQYFLATLKQTPSDAEIISHQLMLRAGMIRKVTSGIYTWLPLGLRVLRKVEQIIREEMTRCGALEVLMPAIQPAELWQETGRWDAYGDLMLRIKDRHERDFCFGPTHEEVITDLVRNEIQSYKQLPKIFYQIQNKFRDEVRPRFGIMRAREFLMKDAYSFHLSTASLAEAYEVMYKAYNQIFKRLGLNYRAVLADTGDIGGSYSHEFQVLANSGEDLIAFSDQSDYAANIEKAEALLPERPALTNKPALNKVHVPEIDSLEAWTTHLGDKASEHVKTILVKGTQHKTVALVLRADHTLNTIKATKHPLIASPLEIVEEELWAGPLHLNTRAIPVIADLSASAMPSFICGAGEAQHYFENVCWGRDLPEPEQADLRNVIVGDLSPDGQGRLNLARGIEVGHIFQLGDKYSQAMHATVLNESGESITLYMGCYGIGVSRIVAAAIEQNHDAQGIIWPEPMAPYKVAIVPIQYNNPDVKRMADQLYEMLLEKGVEVLLDDRAERPGIKFADMDLMGIPYRLVVSEKSVETNTIEFKDRRHDTPEMLSMEVVLQKLLSSRCL